MTMTDPIRLLNYTPHPVHVTVLTAQEEISPPLLLPSVGEARAEEIVTPGSERASRFVGPDGREVLLLKVEKSFGNVTGLPDPQPLTMYVVSALVQQALPMRRDLVSPHGLIRDGQGRVVGCDGLYRITP